MMRLRLGKLMARAGLAALALTVVASCAGQARLTRPAAAPAPAPTAQPAPDTDRLYALVDAPRAQGGGAGPAAQLAVVDALSGERVAALPGGAVAADWSVLYTAQQQGSVTLVRALDPRNGLLLRQTTVAGSYRIPDQPGGPGRGLSPDGRWLALEGVPAPANAGSPPASRFAVLDTRFSAPAKTLALAGNLGFDGLSNDGRSLYLIEDQSQQSSGRYQVRLYDLATGTLQPDPVVDKSESEIMEGWRVASVASADGQWLFSLYLRTDGAPFVHALNLDGRYAICIDLPAAGQDSAGPPQWSLALDAGRGVLFAVDAGSGQVVELAAHEPQVLRSAHFAPMAARRSRGLAGLWDWLSPVASAKEIGAGSAAVLAPDGKSLYALGRQGLVVLDTYTLEVRGRYLAGWHLAGLSISPDGRRLYAARPDAGRIVQIDAAGGALLAQVPVVNDAQAVLRVETVPRASLGAAGPAQELSPAEAASPA